jgi:hypothetical protein
MYKRIGLLLGCLWVIFIPMGVVRDAFSLLLKATPTETATELPTAGILSPSTGQVVQGKVPVVAFTAVRGFQSAELYFGYTDDQTGTWFLIAQSTEPAIGVEIGTWDTNLITDGNYRLRLVVMLQDGSKVDVIVSGLRVRNYSPIETSTPTPVTPTATLSPGERPTSTVTPMPTITATATLLPTNPAEMTTGQIASSLSKGALGTLSVFLFLGIYWLIKRSRRKSRFDHESE